MEKELEKKRIAMEKEAELKKIKDEKIKLEQES